MTRIQGEIDFIEFLYLGKNKQHDDYISWDKKEKIVYLFVNK